MNTFGILMVSNLIPEKTERLNYEKTFIAIFFEIKKNPYMPIFGLVGIGVSEISE